MSVDRGQLKAAIEARVLALTPLEERRKRRKRAQPSTLTPHPEVIAFPPVKNCGTGAGGFTEGNSCAAGGGGGVTATPEFRTWFGDSKAVDADGKPMVLYHGTRADFSTFDPALVGSRMPFSQVGFYTTSNAKLASTYADSIQNSAVNWNPDSKFGKPLTEGANVMPVYLSLQNPLEVEIKTGTVEATLDAEGGRLVKEAFEAGHDGVIVRLNNGDEWDSVAAVAFRPEQMKSATGNAGTFDANDPDITKSCPVHGDLKNCGNGAGGFQPGNTCARGGGDGEGGKLDKEEA